MTVTGLWNSTTASLLLLREERREEGGVAGDERRVRRGGSRRPIGEGKGTEMSLTRGKWRGRTQRIECLE
jgi:hypothetical protein